MASECVRIQRRASVNILHGTRRHSYSAITVQGQAHLVNGTLRLCHTSCELLDAGPAVDYFSTVVDWIQNHPYDVVTILISNADYVEVGNFTAPIQNSGLETYAYVPPKVPMGLSDWPSLSSMILSGKRAVIFMDYAADQSKVPNILDEFSQMFETPFSPTNRSFPCEAQRPPGLKGNKARDLLYMANHNLNVAINIANISEFLIPNTIFLNETNNITGFGSLGTMAITCKGVSKYPDPQLELPDNLSIF